MFITKKNSRVYIDCEDFKEGLLDNRLIPWDSRIHDSRKIRDNSDRWLYKRGWFFKPSQEYIAKVELELRMKLIESRYLGYTKENIRFTEEPIVRRRNL